MYTQGVEISVKGVPWVGVVGLSGNWWIAFRLGDLKMTLKLVQDDELTPPQSTDVDVSI